MPECQLLGPSLSVQCQAFTPSLVRFTPGLRRIHYLGTDAHPSFGTPLIGLSTLLAGGGARRYVRLLYSR